MVKEINDAAFNEAIKNGIVIVDFWASWCGPCKMLGPVIEELSEELSDKADFLKLNVDDNPVTANVFRISSIPTVIIFKDGKIAETLVGFRPKAAIKSILEKYI